MASQEDEGRIFTLEGPFQDPQLPTVHSALVPFVHGESAQSHILRVIDLVDPEVWDHPSTVAISKEVILTLLQCAARLHEDGVYAKEAADIIKCNDFRTILSLGIQDKLSQVFHQRCVEHNTFEEGVVNSRFENAGLLSVVLKNRARQLNIKAMIIEHSASLCQHYGSILHNVCDSARIDEPFMFHNYTALISTLSMYERSLLVTLFPDLFQWASEDDRDDVSAPNSVSRPHDAVVISKDLHRHIIRTMNKEIQDTFTSVGCPKTPPCVIDKDDLNWLGRHCSGQQGSEDLLPLVKEWKTRSSDMTEQLGWSRRESFCSGDPLELPNWKAILRKTATEAKADSAAPSALRPSSDAPCNQTTAKKWERKLPVIHEESQEELELDMKMNGNLAVRRRTQIGAKI